MMIAIHSIAESEALPFFSWKIYPANASSVYQVFFFPPLPCYARDLFLNGTYCVADFIELHFLF